MTQTALLSVYDKTGIEDFAKGLVELDFTLYASGGTAQKLQDAGITVKDAAELAGGGAILGHRVVTLSREIYAGLLAENTPEDTAELEKLNIPRIDLVCCDMYPLREAIAETNATDESVIEKTDIGGPTMLRAAAKGRRIVLSRADQRGPVLDWLKAGKPDEAAFLRKLAADAETEVASYILDSAKWLQGNDLFALTGYPAVHQPKYGENPWQKTAHLYGVTDNDDPLALHRLELPQGAAPSYTNYTDIDRMLQSVTHVAAVFERNTGTVPCIAIGVKHGNACGAAYGDTPAEAIKGMLEGDERAIFGGAIMVNFKLDEEGANLIMFHHIEHGKRLIDVVVASEVTPGALKVLERKGDRLKVFTNPALANLSEQTLDTSRRFRTVRGGIMTQDNYGFVIDQTQAELELNGKPFVGKLHPDQLLAWGIGMTSNSNTITLARNGKMIGNGVGQQDRVSAAKLAVERARSANHDTTGAVAFGDSFFPFPDGPGVLADAGIKSILTTRGSVKDGEVLQAMLDAGVDFYTLPDELGRGFFGH